MKYRIAVPSTIVILVAVAGVLFAEPPTEPWQSHYDRSLPEGFDPWHGPVVGVDGPTAVTVAHATLDNGLPVDIFYPPGHTFGALLPSVVFLAGTSDTGNRRDMGRPWADTSQALGWARLAAEHGLIAVTYENDGHPTDCLGVIGEWLVTDGADYGIDTGRVGVWSASLGTVVGNAALSGGHDDFAGITPSFAVFYYGSVVAGTDHDITVPVLVVLSETDTQVDVGTVSRVVERMRELGGDATLIRHMTGRHGFDIRGATDETREVIAATLDFMAAH